MKFIRKYGIGFAFVGFLTISIAIGIVAGKSCVRTELKFVEVVVEKPVEVLVEVEPERAYFDVPLSQEVQDVVFDECEKHDIDPALVIAIIERESSFTANAVNGAGTTFGLMQIKKDRHENRMKKLNCTDLFNPVQNVKVGIDYLAEMKNQDKGILWTLMAYNGGWGYANDKTEQGVVSNYATSVLARAYEIEEELKC